MKKIIDGTEYDIESLATTLNKMVGLIMFEFGWSYKEIAELSLSQNIDIFELIVGGDEIE